MMTCAYCERPANNKLVRRDEHQRVREVYVCDDHDPTPHQLSQKEYMEKRGFK